MAKTMRAAVLKEYNKPYVLEDVPIPEAGQGDVLLRIKAGSYCHTEKMVVAGEFKSPLPIIPSHEPVGIVEKIGPGVKGFVVGQRVGTLAPYKKCGKCVDCAEAGAIYCQNRKGMSGITQNGAMAEFMVADADSIIRLPDSLSFEKAAPLMCAGATIYQSIKKAEQEGLKPGGVLGIVGCGGLGLLGLQFAKIEGYKVVAVDTRDAPLDMARKFEHAPDLCINSKTTSAKDAVDKITNQLKGGESALPGLDAVIVCTDPIPAYTYGLDILARHGTMVVVGQPQNPIPLTYYQLIFRDVKVVGSLLSEPETAQKMVDLVGKHGVHIEVKTYSLDRVNDLVAEYDTGKVVGKLVVTM